MPDRLPSVRDALFSVTQQVRLLGDETDQDDLAAVMSAAEEPLEALKQARARMSAPEWGPNREHLIALAQAAIILHRQYTGLLPRSIPGRGSKKPQTFTIESVTKFCQSTLSDFNNWLSEATTTVGRINGARSEVAALRQALSYLRRRNDDYAVTYYVREHMDDLRKQEELCDKSMLAARSRIVAEREETLPLIEGLRQALAEIEKNPKDRSAKSGLREAADTLMAHARDEDD